MVRVVVVNQADVEGHHHSFADRKRVCDTGVADFVRHNEPIRLAGRQPRDEVAQHLALGLVHLLKEFSVHHHQLHGAHRLHDGVLQIRRQRGHHVVERSEPEPIASSKHVCHHVRLIIHGHQKWLQDRPHLPWAVKLRGFPHCQGISNSILPLLSPAVGLLAALPLVPDMHQAHTGDFLLAHCAGDCDALQLFLRSGRRASRKNVVIKSSRNLLWA
mmetsp:Transcript_42642/g.66781  ORF Transcript_42642/g.66781 Transcript_42642/m.66781 type:complete len:216 (-) Transcript_42642:109-756(-)